MMYKFLIESFVECDCINCDDPIKLEKRRISLAATTALRKYLQTTESPYQRYNFNRNYIVRSEYDDKRKQFTSKYESEETQYQNIFNEILSMTSVNDNVVIHFWGHANSEGIGAISFDTLFKYMSILNERNVHVNLMGSCKTAEAMESASRYFSNAEIWTVNRGVRYTVADNYNQNDEPSEYNIPDDWNHDFDIPFLIYDCFNEETGGFDFKKYQCFVAKVPGYSSVVYLSKPANGFVPFYIPVED